MANFVITSSYVDGFQWEIRNLQYPWVEDISKHYSTAQLFDTQFESGIQDIYLPHGKIYDYFVVSGRYVMYPNIFNSIGNTGNTAICWTPSTVAITFYPFIIDVNNILWGIGTSQTIPRGNPIPPITWFPPAASRPPYFNWQNPKIKDYTFNLSATEWNLFTHNINLVRSYKHYAQYCFTIAFSGITFNASMYNEAVIAIKEITGYGAYLSMVMSGGIITAYMMQILVSELNAIQ